MTTPKPTPAPCERAEMVRRRIDMDIEPTQIRHGQAIERIDGQVTKLVKELSEKGGVGQPDWLTVDKPKLAEHMLLDIDAWMAAYGQTLGLTPPSCWPWHPVAVSLLLSTRQFYAAAYGSKSPRDSVDFWQRVLPGMVKRLNLGGADCMFDSCRGDAHVVIVGAERRSYTTHRDELPALAAWWATSREGVPPGLTVRIEASRRAS